MTDHLKKQVIIYRALCDGYHVERSDGSVWGMSEDGDIVKKVLRYKDYPYEHEEPEVVWLRSSMQMSYFRAWCESFSDMEISAITFKRALDDYKKTRMTEEWS